MGWDLIAGGQISRKVNGCEDDLEVYNAEGNLFIEFCPIRHTSWEIQPGKRYSLTYRILVFDGEISVQEAENYWKSFVK